MLYRSQKTTQECTVWSHAYQVTAEWRCRTLCMAATYKFHVEHELELEIVVVRFMIATVSTELTRVNVYSKSWNLNLNLKLSLFNDHNSTVSREGKCLQQILDGFRQLVKVVVVGVSLFIARRTVLYIDHVDELHQLLLLLLVASQLHLVHVARQAVELIRRRQHHVRRSRRHLPNTTTTNCTTILHLYFIL